MGEVKEYPNGTFCWIDLGTTDVPGAKAFYSGLFGWETGDMPPDDSGTYSIFRLDGKDIAGLHQHSPEEGTAAATLDGRVAARTARARVERLQELQERLLAATQASWLGRRLEVLVERADADGAEGRSFREGPESDGVVRVPGLTTAAAGDYVEVEFTAADGAELLAVAVAETG